MKGKFTKLKLLCFLVISFFILGFGGEVKAEVFYSHDTLNYRSLTYFQWFYPSYDPSLDAYCINSSFNSPAGLSLTLMPGLISNTHKNNIINILNTSKTLGLSDGLRYYITQAAIWYDLYGTGTNGITTGFYNWINANYPTEWKTLMDSRSNEITEPFIVINGNGNGVSEDGEYLVSNNFRIDTNNVPSQNYSVAINNGSSTGACILYNGTCSASRNDIPAATNFQIRMDNPGTSSGTVKASFTVTTTNAPTVYDIATYGGLSSQGYQNLVMLTSTPKTLSKTQSVSGNYENSYEISVQKIDADTDRKVAGAVLYILDSNDDKIVEVTSTAYNEPNERIVLPSGDYKLVEHSAPEGYYITDEEINFSIDNSGTVTINGSEVAEIGGVPTISMSDSKVKIKFRKLDEYGNPMSGIKFQIYDYGGASTGQENMRLCAVTDSDGYLTQECSDSDAPDNVNSNGEYTLGIDFGGASGIYMIVEDCNGNATCEQYKRSSGSVSYYTLTSASFYAADSGQQIVLSNPLLSLDVDDSTNVITMNMVNRHYINIGKTDLTSGNEIAGATIVVTDTTVEDDDNVVDEWVSSTEVHEIIGIIPGRRYRLTEETAPQGYIKMVNSIDFIMDASGNVTTYDIDTDDEISDLKGTNYELLITNVPTKTYFSKTSAVTGEEIADAHLKVCTLESYNLALSTTGDGNNCDAFVNPHTNNSVEWVSVEGETHIEDALPVGTYYLVEELAPEGYVKQTNSVSFEVKADGNITKVEMKNEPTKVVISKKDVTTGEEIEGAELKICTLESYENDGAECVPSKPEWSWISGTEPNEIDALPFGDYVLIETLPATGYEEGMIINEELMTVYKFTISQDNNNIKIDVYNQLISVPNTGISTLNLFAIGGLMVFIGYETIKIYRKKALVK